MAREHVTGFTHVFNALTTIENGTPSTPLLFPSSLPPISPANRPAQSTSYISPLPLSSIQSPSISPSTQQPLQSPPRPPAIIDHHYLPPSTIQISGHNHVDQRPISSALRLPFMPGRATRMARVFLSFFNPQMATLSRLDEQEN